MTGLCTDNYRIPKHEVASAALMRLAKPFFDAIPDGSAEQDAAEFFSWVAWNAIRTAAQKITDRQALELTYNEAYALQRALEHCPDSDDLRLVQSLEFVERSLAFDPAREREQLIRKICESIRSYTPAQRLAEFPRMKVRLEKTPIDVLRQILEDDIVNITAADFVREAVGQ